MIVRMSGPSKQRVVPLRCTGLSQESQRAYFDVRCYRGRKNHQYNSDVPGHNHATMYTKTLLGLFRPLVYFDCSAHT